MFNTLDILDNIPNNETLIITTVTRRSCDTKKISHYWPYINLRIIYIKMVKREYSLCLSLGIMNFKYIQGDTHHPKKADGTQRGARSHVALNTYKQLRAPFTLRKSI